MLRQFSILLYISGATLLSACQNDGSTKNSKINIINSSNSASFDGPYIKFDTTCYNFGKVYEGERVGAYFKYKNTGSKNLVLTNISTSCGCTVPDYNSNPLAPGMEGEVKAVFNTEGRTGYQFKTLNVKTNGEPAEIELTITAVVIEK
jgi:hypothetical protein